VPPDLYEITGVPRDAGAARLRYVYEQQVDDAARRQDHHRLLELSRALDGLPAPTRLAMYPRAGGAGGGGSSTQLSTPARATSRPRRRGRSDLPRPQGARRRGISGRQLVGFLALIGLLAGFHFVTSAQRSTSSPLQSQLTFQEPVPVPVPEVDVSAVQLDLERVNGRADITCSPPGPTTATELTCQASDGTSWAVSVYAPPDRYTVKLTRYSVYHDSASLDVMTARSVVQQCRRMYGELPVSVFNQLGQAQTTCGRGTTAWPLQPGDRLDYQRLTARTFTITVTAVNGETVSYSSKTGKTSP
jgi:hypothetical protein